MNKELRRGFRDARLLGFVSAALMCVLVLSTPVFAASSDRTITIIGNSLKEHRSEDRTALIIGNSNYNYSPLRNPVNDARAMAQALDAIGFDVILKLDASFQETRRAMIEFGDRLDRGGVGLFYYAGHGVQVVGRNYLIPIGADIKREDHVEAEAVDLQQVLGRMGGAGNRLNIVILDACRNNPFARSFRDARQGLAQPTAPSGTFIAYATGPGEVAADGDGKNSIYTAALLRTLREPGLKLEDVFKQVRASVQTGTDNSQVPWTSSSIVGDFYFLLPEDQDSATEPGNRSKADNLFWESIRESKDPADFGDYLDQFPNGTFVGLAERKLAALSKATSASSEPSAPAFTVDGSDQTLFALKNANVRSEPSTSGDKIATLNSGTSVAVTGEVAGRDWLRVRLDDGRTGYVYDRLLGERQVASVAGPVAQAIAKAEPGQTFRDCPECPEMVVIPGGSFMMGSPTSESGRQDDESPQHRVTIKAPFAIGKYEVTFAEWDACVAAGGCARRPGDNGWGRGNQPVIGVNWNDAQQYAQWLSQKTGHTYRLPSEAEWEYAARASTRTARPWGASIGQAAANCDGCGSQWDGKQTAPVGSFPANGFGLHDMLGNLWEWTEDCWNSNYLGAPEDGGAWKNGDCDRRVLRGGSWFGSPRCVRSADRCWDETDGRYSDYGFRIARTLP